MPLFILTKEEREELVSYIKKAAPYGEEGVSLVILKLVEELEGSEATHTKIKVEPQTLMKLMVLSPWQLSPFPGSRQAWEKGCVCPEHQPTNIGDYTLDKECPVHGDKQTLYFRPPGVSHDS